MKGINYSGNAKGISRSNRWRYASQTVVFGVAA